MSRSIVTASMLEDLRRSGAEIRIKKDALITPAARDWLKDHRLPVTWDEAGSAKGGKSFAAVMDASRPEMRAIRVWLDRMGGLSEIIEPVGGQSGILSATRRLCGRVFRKEVTKGLVFAHDAAAPLCIANKHNGIRAIPGVNVPSVEEANRELGPNILVIEYPTQTAYQIKQMVERFLSGPTAARPETAAAIEAIEQGGGRADW